MKLLEIYHIGILLMAILLKSFFSFAKKLSNKHYGSWKIVENYNNDLLKDKSFDALRIATGGWSGNESVIQQMEKTIFWSICWKASVSGGLYILDYDKVK